MSNINQKILLGLVFSIAFSANSFARESGKQYLGDTAITAQVAAQLAANPDITSRDINVQTYKNTVELCGFTENETQSKEAERVAASTKGVKKVINKLIVHEDLGSNDNGYLDDSMITARVKKALMGAKGVRSNQINVVTTKGVVQLCGFVDNKNIIEQAVKTAQSVEGNPEVTNNLLVKGNA